MSEEEPTGLPEEIETLLWEVLRVVEPERNAQFEAIAAAHPAHGRQIDQFVREFGSMPRTGSEPEAEQVGPYRLIRPLGSGGQGRVWLAEHRTLARHVALKLIRADLLRDPKARERFDREARTASRLDHPGIGRIFEVGDHEGQPFMAMQFVRGRSLEDCLAQATETSGTRTLALPEPTPAEGSPTSGQRSPVLRVLRLIEKVARALHAAHEADVVHRDIKPSNILIGADGEPTIVDFGIARDLAPGNPALTSTHAPGTPSYMAPEQVRGDATDRRTDVWGLGVLLYQCLTLRRPFTGSTTHQLQAEILGAEPTAVRSLNRQVPGEVATIIARALEKEPSRRYATAADLAEDLRRVRSFEPILARSTPVTRRLLRWCQRNRAASVALGATGLGLLVTSGFLIELAEVRATERKTAVGLALEAADKATGAGDLHAAIDSCDAAVAIAERAGLGNIDPVEVLLRKAELSMLVDQSVAATACLAKIPEAVPAASRARTQLLRGELQNEASSDPDVGLDYVQESLLVTDHPLSRADRLYAEALLAKSMSSACDLLLQARASERKHLLASRMILPLLLLMGRQREVIATAHELSAIFPRDPRPRLMSVLAHSLLGEYRTARTLAAGEPALAPPDLAMANQVVDLVEAADGILMEWMPEVAAPHEKHSVSGETITKAFALGTRLLLALGRMSAADLPSLRVAPCVRRQFRLFLHLDPQGLLDEFKQPRKLGPLVIDFYRNIRQLAAELPDPLLTFVTDPKWRTIDSEGSGSWRDSEARLTNAVHGYGPFASWPVARRLAMTWRISLLNQMWQMRRGGGTDVAPDLNDRAQEAASELIVAPGASADEAKRATSIVAAIGDAQRSEQLVALWEQSNPGHPWPPFGRARLAEMTKDLARAKRQYEECLRRDPNYPQAKEMLARVEAALAK